MTWVKICGITNYEDARVAVDAGADAVGFVFYEKSPRNILPEAAREIVTALPSRVEKVGVFVNSSDPPRFAEIATTATLGGIQLHGEISAYDVLTESPLSLNKYLAVSVSRLLDETSSERFTGFTSESARRSIRAVFLDSGTKEKPGGTGTPFDWEKLAPVVEGIKKGTKVVVAGGLTPANVTEAMRILKPWGVDVSSGVEARPGKKDPEKVRAFINAVRVADENI